MSLSFQPPEDLAQQLENMDTTHYEQFVKSKCPSHSPVLGPNCATSYAQQNLMFDASNRPEITLFKTITSDPILAHNLEKHTYNVINEILECPEAKVLACGFHASRYAEEPHKHIDKEVLQRKKAKVRFIETLAGPSTLFKQQDKKFSIKEEAEIGYNKAKMEERTIYLSEAPFYRWSYMMQDCNDSSKQLSGTLRSRNEDDIIQDLSNKNLLCESYQETPGVSFFSGDQRHYIPILEERPRITYQCDILEERPNSLEL